MRMPRLMTTTSVVVRRTFATKARGGGGSSSGKATVIHHHKKRPRITKQPKDGSVEKTWYTGSASRPSSSSSSSSSASLEMGKYGLKRIDYTKVKPPFWPPPPHPPAKTFLEKYLYPFTLLTIASIAVWAYFNPEEEDMKEYWKRVESGQILLDDDDEDDYDDNDEDWEDDDEEEEVEKKK